MPLGHQPFLQLKVVFDDAVVNHHHPAGLIAVRVSVLLGRTSVGRPPCVADAVIPVERLEANCLLQIAELPFGTP
jgi:hypothetical protein